MRGLFSRGRLALQAGHVTDQQRADDRQVGHAIEGFGVCGKRGAPEYPVRDRESFGNIAHASDSPENAQIEIGRFFNADELFSYTKLTDPYIFG